MHMQGIHSLGMFKFGCEPRESAACEDLSFLLQPPT